MLHFGVPPLLSSLQPAPPPAPLSACSERLARSQAEGQRQKEACNINKSLSSLGDVFQVQRWQEWHTRGWRGWVVVWLVGSRCEC